MDPITINFIEWIATHDEWHFNRMEKIWQRDGYRSRTTNELFEYYLKTRHTGWN